MSRFGFILNSRAGHGGQAEVVHSVAETLRAAGHQTGEYECPSDPAGPVGRALAEQCDVIVACGGDGTVSGVAAAMRGSGKVLGVLPLGTLNHLAKDLGMPTVVEAQRVLLEGRVRQIDVGILNGHCFVNNSGIGIYPAMVAERERVRKKGIPKWPAFVVACVRSLMKLPFLRLQLECDGRHLARVTPFLFVGNNEYETGGFSVGTRRRLDAGTLGVCTARTHGAAALFRIAFHAILGHAREDRELTILTARELVVRTRGGGRVRVSLDGELHRMKPPLHYSIEPAALRVLAP